MRHRLAQSGVAWAVCAVCAAWLIGTEANSLPGRPPSPSKILFIPVRWECKHCSVSMIRPPDDKHTTAAQAWCAASCSFESTFPRWAYSAAEQNENFLIIVNRWVQEVVSAAQVPFTDVCESWHDAADGQTGRGSVLSVPACPTSCEGPQHRMDPVTMHNTIACKLGSGHISITPVQIVLMPLIVSIARASRRLLLFPLLIALAVVAGSGVLVGMSVAGNGEDAELPAKREMVRIFSYSAWYMPESSGSTCGSCSAGSASCVQRSAVQLTPVSGRFEANHIPATEHSLIFGTQRHVTELTEKQIKEQWKAWNRDVPLHARIEARVSSPSSVQTCPNGVSSACLDNKGAVSAPYCRFKNQCWSKSSLFGIGHAQPENGATFMLRGRTSFRLNWFRDTQCGFYWGRQDTRGPSHFTANRQSFQIQIDDTCETCGAGAKPGVQDFDSGSGVVSCRACASMEVLRTQRESYAGCNGQLSQMYCLECPKNTEPFQTEAQRLANEYKVPLQCVQCRALLDDAGVYPKGSHRPLGEDGCRNCSASSFFNSYECQPMNNMTVKADFSLLGNDYFKASEYEQLAVADDHWRDHAFQEQSCSCNNRHKYAEFCGGYALRDENAWMLHVSTDALVLLNSMGASHDLEDYVIQREGLCKACESCASGSFNGRCRQGRQGECAACKELSACPSSPPHFLQHEHPRGCVQLRALEDYECVRCKVWEKIGQDYMLLVGCGEQNLRRWTPTAEYVGGELDVAVCSFGDDADTGAQSPQCQYEGAQLARQRPFGNYSSLVPYCAPGWYFSCADSDYGVYEAFSATCCTKCKQCPDELKKKTGLWTECSGRTAVDTQSSHCTARCENNMYENNGTCLYCNTCKEGEL